MCNIIVKEYEKMFCGDLSVKDLYIYFDLKITMI